MLDKAIEVKRIVEGIPLDRLEEICTAEKDGRCGVLPCKVGTKLYKAVINSRTPRASYVLEYQFCWHTYSATIEGLKDKTVFLTRAEAEAVLAGKEKE